MVPLVAYEYRQVEVVRIIDGDSVILDIDMGNNVWWTSSFRLMGIDTPERGRVGFTEAKEFLGSLLAVGLSRIQTHKPDKYGRWLVDLWVPTDSGELHVNRLMVVEGHAVEYAGGKR